MTSTSSTNIQTSQRKDSAPLLMVPIKVSFVLCGSWPSMNQALWLGEYKGFIGQEWVTSYSTTRIWGEVHSSGNSTDED